MYTIENEYLFAQVKPEGAELTNLIHKESKRAFLWHGNPKYWGRHAPILFPFVGKLKNGTVNHNKSVISMGQHGFARDCDFDLLLQTQDEITFELKSNDQTIALYPFDFVLHVNYKLINSSIVTTYRVQNTSDESMYYCIGGHPAYNCPAEGLNLEDYQLKFSENEDVSIELLSPEGLLSNKQKVFLKNDSTVQLNDELFKDDALVFKTLKSNSISLESEKDPLKLSFSWSNFPHMGIWKPIGAPFICLEPWQGMADDVEASGILSEKFGVVELQQKEQREHSYTAEILPY